MKWVTREKAHVDRIACPWLISRFIDKNAEFFFVPPPKVLEMTKNENAIPFDYTGVELGHHGNECSFDAIVKKYNVSDPAVLELATVVRGADMNNPGLSPFSPALDAIATGFGLTSKDDFDNISKQFHTYDALYAYFKAKMK